MVDTAAQPLLVRGFLRRAAHVPLESNLRAGPLAFELVKDALARVLGAVQHEVVEEGGYRVFGDGAAGESVDLVLGGATVQADEAVGSREDEAGGGAVECHGEEEGEFVVGVVFVCVGDAAEVDGGGGGED